MGFSKTTIVLNDPRDPSLAPLEAEALADTDALMLCVPEHVALQLQLEEIYQREVTPVDVKRHLVPYVGPVQVTLQNRSCFVGALVLADDVLLGAVPLGVGSAS